jgi:hypothetical protein
LTISLKRMPMAFPTTESRFQRRSQPINQALPATLKWIESLPPEIQPLAILRDFPRIANGLARTSHDELAFAAYLDMLLIDRRSGRRGFPGDVHSELMCLRDYVDGRYPVATAKS